MLIEVLDYLDYPADKNDQRPGQMMAAEAGCCEVRPGSGAGGRGQGKNAE